MIDLAVVMADTDVIEVDNITFNTSASVTNFLQEENTLKGYNSAIIAFFLEKHNNDVALVAQKLDIGKSTLYKMIQNGSI